MAIFRIQMRWTNFSGAPGYSAFHFDSATEGAGPTAQQCADAVGTLVTSWQTHIPDPVNLTIESEVQVLNELTGELLSFETITPPALTGGGATGNYSAASGAVIIWNTAGVRRGRRIQGRTFVVPLAATAFATDGTLSPTAQSSMQAAATTFADSITAPVVWARPSGPGASDGQTASITQARVPDLAAVLRSRRD